MIYAIKAHVYCRVVFKYPVHISFLLEYSKWNPLQPALDFMNQDQL